MLMFPVIIGYIVILSLLDQTVLPSQDQFLRVYAAVGAPTLHLLLVLLATFWVARRAGNAPVTHGVLIALASVVVLQGIFLYTTPSLVLSEVATLLVMALGGGLLGGFLGRSVVSRDSREAT